MLRRSILTSLVAAMVLATVATPAIGQDAEPACPDDVADTDFTDVADDNAHADSIRCGVARGIIQGTSSTTYAPSGAVTRGQFASLLAATFDELDLPLPPAAGATEFPDAGDTHGESVRRLTAAGIVSGRADGTFAPAAPITRAQLASLLVNAWSFVLGEDIEASNDAGFADVADGAHADNIAAAVELGLLLGRSDTEFAPNATTRRDQAATAVVRVLAASPAELVGEVWSLDQGVDKIYVYGGDDHEELTTIDVSPAALTAAGFTDAPTGERTVPHMIEFDSRERYAFVAATAGASTLVIDTRTKEVIEVLATGGGSHMAAVTPDDSAVWVAAIGAQQMVEILLDLDADEPTFTVGRQLGVEGLLADVEADNGWEFPSYGPICHQYSSDSSEAWITLGPAWNQGGFFVLDLESGTVSDAWDPAEVKANCGVSVSEERVLANWSGEVVEGANTPGEWYVFDPETKELLETFDANGNDTHGLRVTPDGSAYWQVNRESSDAMVIDAQTLEVIAEYDDIAETPDILDFNADGSLLYISQRGPAPVSGAAHAAAGGTPGVRVVDTSDGQQVGEVISPPDAAVLEVEGVVQNDIHGVEFRIRGNRAPADADA